MKKKKITLTEIAYYLFLLLVAFFVGIAGYFVGETIAYNQNATEVTKVHLEKYLDNYVYCPYCGEELKKAVDE